jgi:hypothetical protein
VGLPGESVESFAAGFDRLYALRPQEIQVGMLKRLRGTPIVRHDAPWAMIYSPQPPYEVMSTKLIDFPTMCRLRRFARYWDLVANSGRFTHSLPVLLEGGSPFASFLALSDWLWDTTRQTHGIALHRWFELLMRFVQGRGDADINQFATALLNDYRRDGRTDTPPCLVGLAVEAPMPAKATRRAGSERQMRHGVG